MRALLLALCLSSCAAPRGEPTAPREVSPEVLHASAPIEGTRLAHGPVVERWSRLPSGLEHTFELPDRASVPGAFRFEPPGGTFLGADARGVRYRTSQGTFWYSHGQLIDATGARTHVPARWNQGAIELAISPELAARTHYPAVLDPSLGPEREVAPLLLVEQEPQSSALAFSTSGGLLVTGMGTRDTAGVYAQPIGLDGRPTGLPRLLPLRRLGSRVPYLALAETHGRYLVGMENESFALDLLFLDATGQPIGRPLEPLQVYHPVLIGTQEGFFVAAESGLFWLDPEGRVVQRRPLVGRALVVSAACSAETCAVVWRDEPGTLFVQRFTISGRLVDLSPLTVASAIISAVVAASDEGFVIAWSTSRPGFHADGRWRRLGRDGHFLGGGELPTASDPWIEATEGAEGNVWLRFGSGYLLRPNDTLLPTRSARTGGWSGRRWVAVVNQITNCSPDFDECDSHEPLRALRGQQLAGVVRTTNGYFVAWSDTHLRGRFFDRRGLPLGDVVSLGDTVYGVRIGSPGDRVFVVRVPPRPSYPLPLPRHEVAVLELDGTLTPFRPFGLALSDASYAFECNPHGCLYVQLAEGLIRATALDPVTGAEESVATPPDPWSPITLVPSPEGYLWIGTGIARRLGPRGALLAEDPVRWWDFVVAGGSAQGYVLWKRTGELVRLPYTGPMGAPLPFAPASVGDARIYGSQSWLLAIHGGWTLTQLDDELSVVGAPLHLAVDRQEIPDVLAALADDGTGLLAYPRYDAAIGEYRVLVRSIGPVRAQGEACEWDAECTSGFCVDSVCCENACDRDMPRCRACSLAMGGAVDGQCTLRADGVPCREAASACDAEEVCDGVSTACPADAPASAGTVCRPAAGVCDADDLCDGASLECPADSFLVSGTSCRAAAGECDAPEACDGASALCPPDDALRGTVCRAANGACDIEETCDGIHDVCPDDALVPDGTPCADGLACNGEEACAGGSCVSSAPPACDDGDPCTVDSCSDEGGCTSVPDPRCCRADAECDDGDACTSDVCQGARCAHARTCCDGDLECDDGDACTIDSCASGACEHAPACADVDAGVPGEPAGGGCECRATPGVPATSIAILLPLLMVIRRRR